MIGGEDIGRLVTEQPNPASAQLGTMTVREVLDLMGNEDVRALEAVRLAKEVLASAAEHVASTFLAGRRTVVLGAGTSGRLAIQEVSELPATFGVPARQFVAFVASRAPVGPAAIAEDEDDAEAAPRVLAQLGLGPGDTVIGVAASGRTPFVLAGLTAAHRAGAWSCGIASNPNTPLLQEAELGILLATGPEILTGSTRLKAGTAAKLALNRITTAAMVAAGRVTGSYMTEMTATNRKLRSRAITIVENLAAVDEQTARDLLKRSNWHVSDAIRLSRPA